MAGRLGSHQLAILRGRIRIRRLRLSASAPSPFFWRKLRSRKISLTHSKPWIRYVPLEAPFRMANCALAPSLMTTPLKGRRFTQPGHELRGQPFADGVAEILGEKI